MLSPKKSKTISKNAPAGPPINIANTSTTYQRLKPTSRRNMAFKTTESLDTNIILRIIFKDVPEQCLHIQDLFMRHNVTYQVADLAITEAVYVLQDQGCDRPTVVSGLQNFLQMPHINANFNLFNQVFPMYLENPKLSFNDCCLSVYAALNEAEPLWTFDQALAKSSPTAKLL